MLCVIIESPYNGTPEEIQRNTNYAILAMRDCLIRGEAPFVSHLLYTQVPSATSGTNFVSDDDETNRCVGRDRAIEASMAWGLKADKTIVYTDLGITKGMKYGIDSATKVGRPVEYRTLPNWIDFWLAPKIDVIKST